MNKTSDKTSVKTSHKLHCKRCGYIWSARIANPKECPNCKTYDWKRPNVRNDLLKVIKRMLIERDGSSCHGCGSKDGLDIGYLNYPPTNLNDFSIFCLNCRRRWYNGGEVKNGNT